MAKVIILNGAPGAGKDTIAAMLQDYRNDVLVHSFKTPMFDIAKAMLGASLYEQFIGLYDVRSTKETKVGFLCDRSPREFMIWISEEVIKPCFGKMHFGYLASETMSAIDEQIPKYKYIFSDGGFADEVISLIDNGHEVKLIRLHRDGFTFEGDSRSNIHLNPMYYGKGGGEGYSEHDLSLIDGEPETAVKDIIETFLK